MTPTEAAALKMARDALALNADLDPQTPIVERLAKTRAALAAIDALQSAAARAVPAPAPSDMEDPVMVPRGLIGAACSALDFGREAPKTLAELRRYTIGDRSGPTAAAPQAQAVRAPNGLAQRRP